MRTRPHPRTGAAGATDGDRHNGGVSDPSPADLAADLAARLLDAHTRFVVDELRGGGFADLVADEVDHALARAGELTLGAVVERETVKAVALKYVARFDLPGAIPEIVGEVGTRLRTHPANSTLLGDVVARRHVAAFTERLAAIRPIRAWLAVQLTENPAVHAWLADYLHSLTTGAVETNLRLAKKVPGVSLGLSLGNRIAGGAVREAELRSREVAEQAAGALLNRWRTGLLTTMSDEDIAEALMSVWDTAADRPVRDLLDAVDDDDLIDLLTIGYDGWLDVREHVYLASLIETAVDYVFDTYGETPLDELLAEFGLDRDDLVEEALRFAPPAIDALAAAGLLDDLVRRQLARFYDSPAARAILAADRTAPG
jgi:hypothetical protein